ncbi:MAG: DUF4350 domain-containing protein [Pirellulaceae bacterium]
MRRVLILFGLLLAGCSATEIDATYGRRRGSPGMESVNGTAVLAHLFEQAGFRVMTWRRLSPKLYEFQTIVWFPDSFQPPTDEQRWFLERWLGEEPGRTLVYVGRDYDATMDYWQKVQPTTPPAQVQEVARRLALAQARFDNRRAAMPKLETNNWFRVRRDAVRRDPRQFTGAWATGLDGSRAEIRLNGRLEIPPRASAEDEVLEGLIGRALHERLLASEGDTVVGRVTWEDAPESQLIFVANGSFLLNLPLVNREHRRLARRLIESCGPPGKVAFIESEEDGPPVYEREPGATAPTGFEAFTVWPLGVILVHLTALGILACVAYFPIFGRPRELPAAATADFGKHIEALGKLLEQTGDTAYARRRIQIYYEQVRRDSAALDRPPHPVPAPPLDPGTRPG